MSDISGMATKVKKPKKAKEYGVFQVDSPRHGKCWAFKIEWKEDSKRQRKSQVGYATKEEAQAVFDEIRRTNRLRRAGVDVPAVVNTRSKITTIIEAVRAYLEHRRLKKKKRKKSKNPHARRFSSADNLLFRWAEFAGEDRAVRELDYDDLLRWVEHELDRGTVQLQSISRSLNSIRACLRYAAEKYSDLKAWKVPKKPLKAEECDVKRSRPLEEEEIVSLAKFFAADEKYIDALHFLAITLGTASRMDEVLALRWEDINFKERKVKLFASKTQKPKNLEVEAVVDLLAQRKKKGLGNEIFVFTCRDHWIRKSFAEAAEACDILYGQRTEGGFTPHDLRGTALTALLSAGIDLATVSKEYAGHGDIKLTARYLNATRKSKERAAAAAGSLVGLVSSVEVEAPE